MPPALKGQAQAPAPAAAPGRPQPAQGCNPWDLPPLASLSAAAEGHKQEADKQSRKRKATVEQVGAVHLTILCGIKQKSAACVPVSTIMQPSLQLHKHISVQ
jgi:hypothetical protein